MKLSVIWSTNPKAAALDKEFRRMTKELLLKSGMSKEGANVSALSDVPSDHEQLLMDMAEENHNAKVAKENEKEKKRKVAQALFGHEQDGLANQGVINTCTNNMQCKNVDEYDNDDFMHTPGDSLTTTQLRQEILRLLYRLLQIHCVEDRRRNYMPTRYQNLKRPLLI